ncbi:MAG TPA: hypothetical protein EYM65_09355 [Dehalococcoidia bacterium]|nr:hypothetical protein [Dehalococcoidia bacterium]
MCLQIHRHLLCRRDIPRNSYRFLALSRAPVTVVSPINASSPLITLALAHIFLRRLESLNWTLVLGTLISVGGVVLVVLGAEGG